ncbi:MULTISPECIES: TIGR01548 family HAD-type hydrolase [unclassified Coleofasciculus]|uniref:TIGR01548 family HAD-type hydrolase n=1 Tax=unclassified Coleofasciculus TaxID=2692782 RepID=UPI0018827179|nr:MULTISPECIES: TIGR01548 family HAD-type hydrolase [unclassified Coleofasciculus]MBE9130170.1 TIGR01548 family HAD-type hydrolase [Coleofasciculus sp. LEGE 07081]MBE9152501.1 TIGR01548 family HAD-type hydrolase [Coleofasciculus sp. LEGE 07092]
MTSSTSKRLTPDSTAVVVFDIDGVVRDVSGSYRRAIADTVEHFTDGAYRPSLADIDQLKSEGVWNNDWEASRELVYRHFEGQVQGQSELSSVRLSVSALSTSTLRQAQGIASSVFHLSKGHAEVSAMRTPTPLDYDSLVTFFNSRYRGSDPENWTGYICNEPLLLQVSYLECLTSANILWGFFSGATRDEALYALSKRLNLQTPILVAMEDAPGKPNPTGLIAAVEQLQKRHDIEVELPTIYVGDTVADMYTVEKARTLHPERHWVSVGILPPHVQETAERREAYEKNLKRAGAARVFSNVQQLTPEQIWELLQER